MLRIKQGEHQRYRRLGVEILTAEQEVELVVKAKQGDQDARRRIIEGALPYVLRIVSKYTRWRRIDLEDLRQQAFTSVVRSFEVYDPEKSNGGRFCQYAAWYAERMLQREVHNGANAVPIRHSAAVSRAFRALRDGVADVDTLVREHDVPEDTAFAVLYWVRGEEVVLLPGGTEVEAEAEAAADSIDRKLMQQRLGEWIEELDPRLRHIVKGHFDEQKDNNEIGAELGICRERVRQLLEKALQQLRRAAKAEGLVQV